MTVEPGTDGYARIIEARDRLIAAGLRIAAARTATPARSRRDRLVPLLGPGQPLLAAPAGQGRLAEPRGREVQLRRRHPLPAAPAPARITRKPQIRKGLVQLELCTRDEGLDRATVSKRHGELYRAARDVAWGGPWPPEGTD